MKHHILEVSLAVLIGAACLGADSNRTCNNACEAAFVGCQADKNNTYTTSLATYQTYYNTCVSPISSGTTYGGCLSTAYQNDCVPLVDGNCKNSTAWGNDYTACGSQFLGPNGTCAAVQQSEDNSAYGTQQTGLSQCTVQDGACATVCPSTGTCNSSDDCVAPNFNSNVDQGPICNTAATPPTCVAGCEDPSDDCYGEAQCCGDNDGGGGSCGDPGNGEEQSPDGCQCNGPSDCETDNCQNNTCMDDDPIIVDLTGAGFPLTNKQEGVKFDFFGTGNPAQMAWTAAGSSVGWLALDRNGNGLIDNGADLFSNVAPQPESKVRAKLGFRALAVYDLPANGGNGDGLIDQRDAVFSKLLVWVDKNHNGISDPGELLTMQQAGIRSISLDFKPSFWTDAYGNQFRYRGKVAFAGGNPAGDRYVYDVILVSGGKPTQPLVLK